MKILIIGLLAFFGWSAVSTYIYVCRIKGLCYEPLTVSMSAARHTVVTTADTLYKPLMQEQAVIPKNLLIYFAFDKSEFNSDEASKRYLIESNTYLDQNTQARLSITGHTDAIGSGSYNQALGYRRAQSLKQYFESKGMPAYKIIIESKGENEPAGDNHTKAGRANNRRTVITIKK